MSDEGNPLLSEEEYWDQQATILRRTGLTRIRATAEKWQATIGTLLGLFGVVAFVEGPDKLAEVSSTFAQAVLITGVVLTAILASVALGLAAYAAQGVPRRFRLLTGPGLALSERNASDRAADFLTWSRRLAITAAGVLVAGSVAAWIIGLAKDKGKDDAAPSVIVVTGSGKAVCGALAAGEGNSPLRLVDAEDQTLLDLSTDVASLTVVDSCPEPR